MASEEPPMFDPALKKKKKKKVVFSEDPLGADADDLEPTHAPVKEVDEEAATEDTNMFEGMKKKKKKKAVTEASDEPPLAGPTSPAAAEDVNGDGMFDGLKKKKKKRDIPADLGDDVVTPNPPEETPVEAQERISGELNAVEDGGDMFEGMKKKKKKKEIPMELEASPAPEGAEAEPVNGSVEPNADEADMFASMKKKKKKDIPAELDGEAAPDAAAAAGDDFDFSDLKKKKKKAKKALDMEAFERELEEANAGDRKPKKVKQPEDDEDEEGGEDLDLDADLGDDDPFAQDGDADVGEGDDKWLNTDRDYTYDELLVRFYRVLRQNNPELAGGKRRHTVPPPSVMRDGNKKTIFANIVDIAKRIHRQPDHVISFLFAELGTTGSVDGSSRLVIKGRFQQKQLENVLRRYIVEYVTCKTCKSPDTLLEKENRIFFVQCESCGSRRSVSAVKTGFQAQVGKRSKTKPVT